MTLKVIGTGLGRTGTNSLKLALEQLGFDRCHHMYEVIGNPDQAPVFLAAAQGEPVDWDKLFEGYQSSCDWPSCHFWRELTSLYLDAKVILSTRSAESWYASMNETILAFVRQGAIESRKGASNPHLDMILEIIYKQTFSENVDDKDHLIEVFEKHNQSVRDTIAPNRLLEFEAKDGWEPLCAFLGVPVPDTPYPKTNSKEDFQSAAKERMPDAFKS